MCLLHGLLRFAPQHLLLPGAHTHVPRAAPRAATNNRPGVRYVQPPLGYPSERRRRLRSLTFADAAAAVGVAGAAISGAADDPKHPRVAVLGADALEAAWLPVLVCAAWVPDGQQQPIDAVPGAGLPLLLRRLQAASGGACPAEQALGLGGGAVAATAAAAPGDHPGGCGGRQQQQQAPGPCPPPAALTLFAAQHGMMPMGGPGGSYACGPLGAHWSMYYETHARRPDDTTLAPWVAHVYKRRLKRKAVLAERPR